MEPQAEFKESIESITSNGKYKLYYTNPKTPQKEFVNHLFVNDLFISLQQVKAGDVCDLAETLPDIRAELGLNASQRHTD